MSDNGMIVSDSAPGEQVHAAGTWFGRWRRFGSELLVDRNGNQCGSHDKSRQLPGEESKSGPVTFGVVGTGDPRIDEASRQRAANIVGHRGRPRGGQCPHARRQGRSTWSGRRCWSTARSRPTWSAGSSARRASMP